MRHTLVFSLVLMFCSWIGALTFTTQPSLTSAGGGRYQVEFALDESTDVEVAIVNLDDSSIVRHVAAGVLGSNPPAPLAANTLHQTLAWDGTDDQGVAVSGGNYDVRVRAGMQARLDKIADKVRQDGVEKSNNYFFAGADYGSVNFFGLALDDNGALYIQGISGLTWYGYPAPEALRSYDAATGAYQKTLFPLPADLDRNLAVPYGALLLGDNAFNLKCANEDWPSFYFGDFQNSIWNTQWKHFAGALIPQATGGKVAMLGYSRMQNVYSKRRQFNEYAEISTGSEMVTKPALITSPELPLRFGGPMYLCRLDDQTLLMAGIYGLPADSLTPLDTGFWRDGQVFKIDMVTGAATQFISLNRDSLPKNSPSGENTGHDAAIHGIAVDDSGRVFICDRMHQQIGVYDAAGQLIKAIPQAWPDNICVNSATGELFVSSRGPGTAWMRKYSDWRGASPAVTASFPFYDGSGYGVPGGGRSHMVLHAPAGGSPVLWWTLGQGEIKWASRQRGQAIYGLRDDGSALTVISNFSDSTCAGGSGYVDRIAVDRKRDIAYVTEGWATTFKVEDWNDPVMVPCSTSRGEPLSAIDMQVDKGGNLYTYGGGTSYFDRWICRFTGGHLHDSLPFGGTGLTSMADSGYNEFGAGCKGEGFGIAPDGRVTVVHQYGNGGMTCRMWDTNHVLIDTSVIAISSETVGGVRFDPQGRLYVGGLYRDATHVITPGYETEGSYSWVGSVFKFNPDSGGAFTGSGWAISGTTGCLKTYSTAGIAPFSNGCTCRSPRFDIDGYGRLFIPNAVTNTVAVVDNEDNLIMRFGRYGNTDTKGPGVPMLYPVGAAASDNYIYVADQVNTRLLRVSMDYALENMHLPGSVASVVAGTRPANTLAAVPNPFNPAVAVILTGELARGASLKVFDVSGKLVADLSNRLSNGMATWNASGNASGVYVLVAEKGRISIKKKIIYSK